MVDLVRVIDFDGCRDSPGFVKHEASLDKRRVSFVFARRIRRLVGRRKLGVAWLVLDPIFYSLIYLFVLTVVRTSPDPRILFIGVSMFRIFSSSFKSGTVSVSDFSGGIKAERVRTRVITTSMLKFRLLDSLIQSSGIALILVLLDVTLYGTLVFVTLSVIMAVLAEGVGLNLGLLIRKIPDLNNVVNSYMMLLLFFGSPAFYSMTITTGYHYKINEYNPFAYFVEAVRYFCGTDSEILELLGLSMSVVVLVVIALGARGYLILDRHRWEESYWS